MACLSEKKRLLWQERLKIGQVGMYPEKKQTYLLLRVLNQMKEQSENLLFKLAITEPESSNMS
jgi:hypothetical protein